MALPEPDAPRRRPPSPPQDVETVALATPPQHCTSVPGRARERTWPRTREEVDVALHSIGLALDELLGSAQVKGDIEAPAVADVRSILRERFANADVDARRLDVIVHGERVILIGVVGDPLSRLIAEDIAWSLPQVAECENRLAVV